METDFRKAESKREQELRQDFATKLHLQAPFDVSNLPNCSFAVCSCSSFLAKMAETSFYYYLLHFD